MTSALPDPGPSSLLTQWSIQPLAVIAVVALATWYVVAVRRLAARGTRWPIGRTVTFGLGLALLLWTTCGFLQAYAAALFWVWTVQGLALLLVVPLTVLAGGPLRLARLRSGAGGPVDRLLRSRPVRVLSNPLVGPALIPLLSAVLFFGPLPGWAVETAPVGWVVQLLVVVAGGLVLLPLVGLDDRPSSLAVGLSLAIGMIELVLDAIPGIVLRLHTGVVSSYFAHRSSHSWTPTQLHDQQTAGAILWVVAEVIDLPFLLLVYRRWLRADERDAATVDAVLDAERIARTGSTDPDAPDAPWWLSDPSMSRRLRRE